MRAAIYARYSSASGHQIYTMRKMVTKNPPRRMLLSWVQIFWYTVRMADMGSIIAKVSKIKINLKKSPIGYKSSCFFVGLHLQ